MLKRNLVLVVMSILCSFSWAGESIPNYPKFDGGQRKAAYGPQYLYRESFSDVMSTNWSGEWERLSLGTGMTTSQGSGNGVINSGTTANSETVFRLRQYFSGAIGLRYKATLSQRIAQNNFFVELVDVIGDGLDCTINSAVSITVRIPTGYRNFSSADVGKSFTVGVISGAAGIPGRYPIASVDATGRLVNLTVAGWPASGSCTLSAWGLSGYRTYYDSTTATAAKFDAHREGWGSGDTTLTINTTASGHLLNLVAKDVSASVLDATTNSLSWTQRGQRTENIPDNTTPMVLQVRALNGTANPASTTAFTLGFITLERFDAVPVEIAGQKALGGADGVPTVNIGANSATNQSMNLAQISGTNVTANNGTAGGGTLRVAIASDNTTNTNPWLVGGTGATSIGKAEDAVAASADTGVPVWGVRRDAATISASAAADYSEITTNRFGAIYTAGFRTHTRTYSATHNITVAASATDIAWFPGNASSTVQITKIRISGIQTTSGTPEVLLILRSTANSGGTSTSFSVGKHEQADAANSSTPIGYTVNPTPGTSAGTIRRQYLPVGSAASGISDEIVFELGENGKPIVLSGTAQGLAINLNGATVTGGVFNMAFEWIEF